MTRSVSAAVAALSVAVALHGAAAELPAPFRALSFEQAAAAARSEQKLVFVDFYTTWCQPCKALDRDTFAQPEIAALIGERAVAIKLDAEHGGLEAAKRFKVSAYPTLLIAKADGTEVDRIIGYREPPAFAADFKRIVAMAASGKNALEQAREKVAQQKRPADAGDEPEEAQPHFELAKKLIAAGQHEEALKELLWCWDEGKKDPEFARLRSANVPRELARLARDYAPAQEALRSRRDQARERALANKGGATVVQDLIHLNRELKMDDDTIAIFDQMPEGDRRKVTISIYLFDHLLEKQRYKDATLFNLPETYMMPIERARAQMKQGGDAAASFLRFTVASTAKRVEALAGAGHADQARELGEKLLTLDGTDETKALLKKHATRAGKPDLFAF